MKTLLEKTYHGTDAFIFGFTWVIQGLPINQTTRIIETNDHTIVSGKSNLEPSWGGKYVPRIMLRIGYNCHDKTPFSILQVVLQFAGTNVFRCFHKLLWVNLYLLEAFDYGVRCLWLSGSPHFLGLLFISIICRYSMLQKKGMNRPLNPLQATVKLSFQRPVSMDDYNPFLILTKATLQCWYRLWFLQAFNTIIFVENNLP